MDANKNFEIASIVWLTVGTSLMATFIGVTAGMSQSPVVATLLPLLFAAIGGAGGFYVLRADLSDTLTIQRLKYFGILASFFAIFGGIGCISGIYFRTGVNIKNVSLGINNSNVPEKNYYIDPLVGLELGVLRHRMNALDMTFSEQTVILESARERLEQRTITSTMYKVLQSVVIASESVQDFAASIAQDTSYSKKDRKIAGVVWKKADLIRDEMSAYVGDLNSGEGFNSLRLAEEIKNITIRTGQIESLLQTRGDTNDLSGKYIDLRNALGLRRAVTTLRLNLLDLYATDVKAYNQDWMTGSRYVKKLDEYLKMASHQPSIVKRKKLALTTP